MIRSAPSAEAVMTELASFVGALPFQGESCLTRITAQNSKRAQGKTRAMHDAASTELLVLKQKPKRFKLGLRKSMAS